MSDQKLRAPQTFQLLNRPIPADYLREWTERTAAPICEIRPDTHSILIFRIGYEWFGLASDAVQELTEASRIHRLPQHRSRVVLGVANVRGQLVACVSLAEFLHLPKPDPNYQRLIVVKDDQIRIAIPAHEVFGIERYNIRDVQKAPATLSESRYTSSILHWKDRSVACLDTGLLLSTLKKALS